MNAPANLKPVAEREVTIVRTFAAPRPLVFSLWTEAKHLARWWGPHGFDNPVCEVDARPGGKIRIDMRAPDGNVHPMGGVFHEVVPHSRIVFTSFVDLPDGTRLLEGRNTATFEDHRGGTRITLHAKAGAFADFMVQALSGMEAGWAQSLDKLVGAAALANGEPDAQDQIAIRAIFGDRTNALFGKVADLAVKHFAPDVVSYDLAPPLRHIGVDRTEIQKWFDTWVGPIGWMLGELTVEISGDLAVAYGLGHMVGKKTSGEDVDLWVRFTGSLRKKSGVWQMTHQHVSVPFYMDGTFKAAVDLKP